MATCRSLIRTDLGQSGPPEDPCGDGAPAHEAAACATACLPVTSLLSLLLLDFFESRTRSTQFSNAARMPHKTFREHSAKNGGQRVVTLLLAKYRGLDLN